jgi:hypothetical protein
LSRAVSLYSFFGYCLLVTAAIRARPPQEGSRDTGLFVMV